jgi:hypothetical protein
MSIKGGRYLEAEIGLTEIKDGGKKLMTRNNEGRQ